MSDISEKAIPRHVAIIMDGNGRWARQRNLPRVAGHKAGVNSLRDIVTACSLKNISILTVYAFSSENWKRPGTEVSMLMELFVSSLQKNINELRKNNIRLRFIGDLSAFSGKLRKLMEQAEISTRDNQGLHFVIAINYGGRWDITRACRCIADKVASGETSPDDINEQLIEKNLSMPDLPHPDLFIRTGGEVRISNYLLWQLAYTELYFTDCLWPDFNTVELDKALNWYAGRERRFGQTSEQLGQRQNA